MAGRVSRAAAAIAAGLALADASVVTLALPPILVDLDASVEGVAAVIGAYTLTLAIALPLASRWHRAAQDLRLGAMAMLAFAVISAGCGLAPNLELLIALRALQGIAAAGVLVAAFDLVAADRPRLWTAAGVLGAAVGPALGGALTQLLDWRAIFLIQAPVVAVAAVLCLTGTVVVPPYRESAGWREWLSARAIGLALVSAALTGVLFLLVLLLISGWALSPLAAAGVVTVVPVAAFLGMAVRGDPWSRAVAGCTLVGAGVLALAFLSTDSVAMTLLPQAIAGLGMGLALPALSGELLPERTATDAANLFAVRHLGITVVLAILAPIAANQMTSAIDDVKVDGTALILDAKLPPLDKIDIARVATADLKSVAPRDELRDSLNRAGSDIDDEDQPAFDQLVDRADEVLVGVVNSAFSTAFIVSGALALAAAALLLVIRRGRVRVVVVGAVVVAGAVLATQAGVASSDAPDDVVIADPCKERKLPDTGGLDGWLQDRVLKYLDEKACDLGSSREELALAVVDADESAEYERKYGVNPRDELEPILDLIDRFSD